MNDSDKKSFGRMFTEGLAFGAGLVVAGGILKTIWHWMTTNDDEHHHSHDDEDEDLYALNDHNEEDEE